MIDDKTLTKIEAGIAKMKEEGPASKRIASNKDLVMAYGKQFQDLVSDGHTLEEINKMVKDAGQEMSLSTMRQYMREYKSSLNVDTKPAIEVNTNTDTQTTNYTQY